MKAGLLSQDPYNLVITGVGGQGNVMASRVLGNMMSRKGLNVTIGETFGASQRGGSVMSHLRISTESFWSPQIPGGKAHMILALEPIETLRVLMKYGGPETRVICNRRPIHPIGVIAGDQKYPSFEQLCNWIEELTEAAWFIDATDTAMKLGEPILGNIIMIGALAVRGDLPMERSDFESIISETVPGGKVEANLKAYDLGLNLLGGANEVHQS
ncbi:MAG: indolepyruvate oxidoreductase subunit beta [Desulfobacterales bacterium]|jgi:indolepyruvate ferredoxin oxidoreductase beta subunit